MENEEVLMRILRPIIKRHGVWIEVRKGDGRGARISVPC